MKILGIVLGGGKGTRLFPLTLIRSKPAVPIGGKYRLIDIPISNCINSGINKIFVLTQYNSASLHRHITQTYKFGVFSNGFVDILAAEQTPESIHWFQGTADAVRQTLRHILNYQVDYILILSGDQLYRMDFRRLLEEHLRSQADITISVIPVDESSASSFGILKMDGQGCVTDFHEKPRDPRMLQELKVDPAVLSASGVGEERPWVASMGIYLFRTPVLVEVLRDETKIDFGRDIIPSALKRYKVCGYVFNDYWEDIGTIKAFYLANLEMTQECARFNFYHPEAPIYTHPRFLPASRLENCRIDNCILSEGCYIKDSRISHSVIGIRSIIRQESELVNTLMMGADYYDGKSSQNPGLGVGVDCSIRDAIIDKNARIGDGVRICNEHNLQHFDGGNYYIRDGIVIVPKNVEIASGSVI